MRKNQLPWFLLLIIILVGCSANKNSDLSQWEGWYGNYSGGQAWIKLYVINDSTLRCDFIEENGRNNSSFDAIYFKNSQDIDLRGAPEYLVSGIPFIESGVKLKHALILKVKKGGIKEFHTEYFGYIPELKKGESMKKMDPPANYSEPND